MAYQLAQVNIARMRAEIDSPVMAEFVANLDRINALAEAAPGFVWRLKTAEGDATSVRVYEDNYIIINMSVWESVDALFQYTYASDHTDIFRRRGEWFTRMETPHLALWWIEADHRPTPEEAKAKLEYLHEYGASPEAFTFKQRFTAEDWLAQHTAEMK
jgi:Domain of unknown function (DUF3291)